MTVLKARSADIGFLSNGSPALAEEQKMTDKSTITVSDTLHSTRLKINEKMGLGGVLFSVVYDPLIAQG